MFAETRRCSRRTALFAAFALGAGALVMLTPRRVRARMRLPFGGRVVLRVPWSLASVDPHRLDDPAAALFGEALFDTLYTRDETGAVVPSLAEAMPEVVGGRVRVELRRGIRTASGAPLSLRDVVGSIARARGRGARAWLAPLPTPAIDKGALTFATEDTELVLRALACPLVAIVPSPFSPERPDGTGPFRASLDGGVLRLTRNRFAANGPAMLDDIVVHRAHDLAESLRSFETGADDIGWLGAGLHEPRPGSEPFDAGLAAWAVLCTGRDAGAWDAPGVAQRLADGISPSRLSYLALGPPWPTASEQGWGGPPCDLLVRDDAPYLVELARALAATLTRPDHEVRPRPIPASELATRRSGRRFALALDLARPLGSGPFGAFASLATADDPSLASEAIKRPPRFGDVSPRTQTRTLRLGVVGEVRAVGARVADLVLPVRPAPLGAAWGDAYRKRKAPAP